MKNFGNAFASAMGNENRSKPITKVRIPREVDINSKQISELERFTKKETRVTKEYIIAKDRE